MQTISKSVYFTPQGQNVLELLQGRRLPDSAGSQAESLVRPISSGIFGNNQSGPMHLNWLQTVFINFFIAACMGLALRVAHVTEIPWMDFKHMMHAHSHVAMLGWLFLLFYGLILDHFITPEEAGKRIYSYFFWAAQLCVIGMMISFPVQGYGAASIAFTTAHLLITYAVAVRLIPKIRAAKKSSLLIRTSLILMIISTLGVWALGFIKAGLFGNAVLYYASIQFFLHFQFNGWFTFAALALVFHQIELSGQPVSLKSFHWFYGLLISSLIFTYALSVAWSTPEDWLFWTNGIGVVIQLAALVVFWKIIQQNRNVFLSNGDRLQNTLFILVLVSFGAKILIQSVVVVPQVAVISYTIRHFVVGFIHLTMLGSISLYLLTFLRVHDYVRFNIPIIRNGFILTAVGFLLTEGFLFLQGILLWMELGFMPLYYELILVATVFLPLGILFIIIGLFQKNEPTINRIQTAH